MQTWVRKTMVGGLLAAGCLAFGLAAAPAGAIALVDDAVSAGDLNSAADLPDASKTAPLGTKDLAPVGKKGDGSGRLANIPVSLLCNAGGVFGTADVECVGVKQKGDSSSSSNALLSVPVTVTCNGLGVLGTADVKCVGEKKKNYGSEGAVSGSGAPAGVGGGNNLTPVKASFGGQLPTTGADLGTIAALGLTLFAGGLLLLRRVPRRMRHSAVHRL